MNAGSSIVFVSIIDKTGITTPIFFTRSIPPKTIIAMPINQLTEGLMMSSHRPIIIKTTGNHASNEKPATETVIPKNGRSLIALNSININPSKIAIPLRIMCSLMTPSING